MSFYSEIVQYYDVIFPLAEPKKKFFEQLLKDGDYISLLDVGCATGTFCNFASKQMARVIGLDLDAEMIAKAKADYERENLTFVEGSMLDLKAFNKDPVDMITCFGNTLVHVAPSDAKIFFEQAFNALNSGGTLVIQILNYDYIFAHKIESLPLIDNEIIRFDRHYDYQNRSAINFETVLTVKATERKVENRILLYPLFREDLQCELERVGFKSVECYKNYHMDGANGCHLPLIIVAKK